MFTEMFNRVLMRNERHPAHCVPFFFFFCAASFRLLRQRRLVSSYSERTRVNRSPALCTHDTQSAYMSLFCSATTLIEILLWERFPRVSLFSAAFSRCLFMMEAFICANTITHTYTVPKPVCYPCRHIVHTKT